MRISSLGAIRCLVLIAPLILVQTAAVVAQEFSVTPSERVTRFVNVREEPFADSERPALASVRSPVL